MLRQIHIKNYALIDQLDLLVDQGLTMITGETGAGKSILLGALGLVTGKRADLSAIRDTTQKCVVEARFDIGKLQLKDFFIQHDLDYFEDTLIRREILPSGKSRAFINDTPATLTIVAALGAQLIDIHSQHQTLKLATDEFQMHTLNAFMIEKSKGDDNTGESLLNSYQQSLIKYKKSQKHLKDLQKSEAQLTKELDYNTFLLNEIEEAQLDNLNQKELEQENEQLSNVELIQETLSGLEHKLNSEDNSIIDELRSSYNELKSIKGFSTRFEQLSERVASVLMELEDIASESERLKDQVEMDPERMEFINQKLSSIDQLYRKHQVDNLEDLMELRDDLADKVLKSQSIEGSIKKAKEDIKAVAQELDTVASALHDKRVKYKDEFEMQIIATTRELGIADAQFKIQVNKVDEYVSYGKDEVVFTFTANKGSTLMPLDKAASGGELSRLMLAIKALLSHNIQLPTIIFDEIDTGVSGSIAQKMAGIMKEMSRKMQVITITHLPQIASAGNDHLIVRKSNEGDRTVSTIEKLSAQDRVEEIAQMLSGGSISDAARENARVLLQ